MTHLSEQYCSTRFQLHVAQIDLSQTYPCTLRLHVSLSLPYVACTAMNSCCSYALSCLLACLRLTSAVSARITAIYLLIFFSVIIYVPPILFSYSSKSLTPADCYSQVFARLLLPTYLVMLAPTRRLCRFPRLPLRALSRSTSMSAIVPASSRRSASTTLAQTALQFSTTHQQPAATTTQVAAGMNDLHLTTTLHRQSALAALSHTSDASTATSANPSIIHQSCRG